MLWDNTVGGTCARNGDERVDLKRVESQRLVNKKKTDLCQIFLFGTGVEKRCVKGAQYILGVFLGSPALVPVLMLQISKKYRASL